MEGIDDKVYEDAVQKYKSEKTKHSAGMRVFGGMGLQHRQLPD